MKGRDPPLLWFLQSRFCAPRVLQLLDLRRSLGLHPRVTLRLDVCEAHGVGDDLVIHPTVVGTVKNQFCWGQARRCFYSRSEYALARDAQAIQLSWTAASTQSHDPNTTMFPAVLKMWFSIPAMISAVACGKPFKQPSATDVRF